MRRLAPLISLLIATASFADSVTVFAAASMKDALDAIARDWQQETQDEITISYAGSALLARQIAEGAPADIFISANSDWMDWLSAKVAIEDRADIISNRLVLVKHESAPALSHINELPRLLADHKLAMADPKNIPAGIYAKEALLALGLWADIDAKIIEAQNVRDALYWVEIGEAPYGIVYQSDAQIAGALDLAYSFAPELHAPILYPAAIIKTQAENPSAQAFFAHLQSESAQAQFLAYGFAPLEPNEARDGD